MRLVWSTPEIDHFNDTELDSLFNHLSINGFVGIEPLYSNAPQFDSKILKRLLQKNEQRIIGLRTGGIALKHGVSFSNPDKSVRIKAINLFYDAIHYASDIGAPLLLVGLLQGRLLPSQSYQEARKYISDCLIDCAKEAEEHQIVICLEAINRFLLGYHSKADEVIGLLKEINLPNVKLLLDTFHMNIEESCIEATLITSASQLRHIHFADNNRLIPGRGSINFYRIARVLKAIDYQGFISIESDDSDWFASISESSKLLLPLIS
jgi:5-keto-L-gluconate epimerase